jgi:hypothetical protein
VAKDKEGRFTMIASHIGIQVPDAVVQIHQFHTLRPILKRITPGSMFSIFVIQGNHSLQTASSQR